MDKKSILIIGGGGFIGGFIAARALELGFETWVGVRSTTSRKYLEDKRLHIVEFDYDEPNTLSEALKNNLPESGRWDYMIWNLGATKCANFADFNRINFIYLKDFVESLISLELCPNKFLYVSSLSALGPGDEKTYAPLDSKTVPMPNTRYGVSKIKAETFLETVSDKLNWIIFRPTGVYGPREKDYLLMVKSIDSGWDVSMGYKKQLLTFIYVEDLVNAMFDALKAQADIVVHKKYILSEKAFYTQKEFRSIVCKHLGRKSAIPLRLPMWMVYAVSYMCEKIAAFSGKASTLNRDKYKIMKQRNWACDISDAERDFGFNPRWSLDDGMRETVNEYLKRKKK